MGLAADSRRGADWPGSWYLHRNSTYGDWQLRWKMVTNKSLIINTVIGCPLNERCGCKCQTKIVQTPTQTILFIADKHTAANYVADNDRAKFLKFKDKAMIADAVKVALL